MGADAWGHAAILCCSHTTQRPQQQAWGDLQRPTAQSPLQAQGRRIFPRKLRTRNGLPCRRPRPASRSVLQGLQRADTAAIGELPHASVLARKDASFETIAQHAVQQIVRQKPRGQLVLAGYSARGDVAYAALSQLIAAGRDVVLLGVFDTSVSGVPYPEPPAPQRTAFDQMGRCCAGCGGAIGGG
jgi:hypothetical protein